MSKFSCFGLPVSHFHVRRVPVLVPVLVVIQVYVDCFQNLVYVTLNNMLRQRSFIHHHCITGMQRFRTTRPLSSHNPGGALGRRLGFHLPTDFKMCAKKQVFSTALVALVFVVGVTDAFAPQSARSSWTPPRTFSTVLNGNTKFPPALPPIKDISYGEESRKYRRTVYTHDDWVKHRNPDRFLYYLRSLFVSGVYKNVGREVLFTTLIAAFVVLWNGLLTGFTGLMGVKHAPILSSKLWPLLALPMTPFTLSSPSLGLLLGRLL
jgi:hypothetical protein